MSARKGPGFRPAGQIRSRMPYRERDCEAMHCVSGSPGCRNVCPAPLQLNVQSSCLSRVISSGARAPLSIYIAVTLPAGWLRTISRVRRTPFSGPPWCQVLKHSYGLVDRCFLLLQLLKHLGR